MLKEENHKLIMVRISGFGQTGPYSPRPGFGRIGNAFGGLSYLAGFPDRPPMTPGSATIPDYLAGLYGALGVMFALRARDMTGRGQFIDIGLYEPMFRILDELAAAYDHNGYVRERMGPGTVNVCPAQPLPHEGRQVDRDRLHVRQDLRPPRRAAGRAGARGRWQVGQGQGPRSRSRRGRRLGHALDADAFTLDRPDRASATSSRCRAGRSTPSPTSSRTRSSRRARTSCDGQDPRVGEIAMPNVVPRLSDTPGKVEWLGADAGRAQRRGLQGPARAAARPRSAGSRTRALSEPASAHAGREVRERADVLVGHAVHDAVHGGVDAVACASR